MSFINDLKAYHFMFTSAPQQFQVDFFLIFVCFVKYQAFSVGDKLGLQGV